MELHEETSHDIPVLSSVVLCESENLDGVLDFVADTYNLDCIYSKPLIESAFLLKHSYHKDEILAAVAEFGIEMELWDNIFLDDTSQSGFAVEANQNTLPLESHGSGVRSIIPILIAVASAERNEIVALEYPENHLHISVINRLADFIFYNVADRGVNAVIASASNIFLKAAKQHVENGNLEITDISRWHISSDQNETGYNISSVALEY